MNQQLLSDLSWDDLKIPEALKKELQKNNFQKPSSAQAKFYECIKGDEDRSGMLEAPTGSGKTIAFVTHALMKADPKINMPQVAIIVHTQILGMQILAEIQKFEKCMNLTSSLCLGVMTGIVFNPRAQIAVCTPGAFVSQLLPHKGRGATKAAQVKSDIKLIILDEADFYWKDKNMRNDMGSIFSFLKNAQILLFSATIDKELGDRIRKEYLSNVSSPFNERYEVTLDNTAHYCVDCSGQGDFFKQQLLDKIFDLDIYDAGFKSIIFCRTRDQVDSIYQVIVKNGYNVSKYHSAMSIENRKSEFENFLSGKTRVLLTTDMLARGIDIVTIALVINFEVPTEVKDDQVIVSPQNYVHRIGRSGRFGRKSVAITFVSTKDDKDHMEDIKKYVNARFKKEDLIKNIKADKIEECIEKELKDQKADQQDIEGFVGQINQTREVQLHEHKNKGHGEGKGDQQESKKGDSGQKDEDVKKDEGDNGKDVEIDYA